MEENNRKISFALYIRLEFSFFHAFQQGFNEEDLFKILLNLMENFDAFLNNL